MRNFLLPAMVSGSCFRPRCRASKVERRDFVYLEQPKNTHNFPFEADEVQFLKALRDFLAKHNPA